MSNFDKKYEQLKREVKRNVKAHNKNITEDFLDKKPVNILIKMCHPNDREAFMERYNKL